MHPYPRNTNLNGRTVFPLRHLPTGVDREPVSSSLLRSVGYDPDQQLLEIELQDGNIYQYTDVPEQTYHGLMAADSHGRYFNHHIRGFNYHRLR